MLDPTDWPVLEVGDWRQRRAAHETIADQALTGVMERRRKGEKHPVEDFLFDYYNLRPGQLRQWQPGAGVRLDDPAGEFVGKKFFVHVDGLSWVDAPAVVAKRASTIQWMHELLVRTASRPAHLGCFGMHEWAMVYHLTPEQTRHAYLPLRLSPETIAEVVESVGVRCSHYDAFRFFTPDAVPLNALRPTRELQLELDQPGCLHANMDCYKWAGKLVPLVGAELLFDCWRLALDIRELDMQASAYDLGEWGYEPVPVETPHGRAEYVRRQRRHGERAAVLRGRLVELLDDLVGPIRP